MATTPEALEEIRLRLSFAGSIRTKAMFGGHGIYADDLFFAIIVDGTVYLKVDDRNRKDFLDQGIEPFRPFDDERAMNYFSIPATVWDDPAELGLWVDKALAVAEDARQKKKPKKR
ncbi:MAG: TfoX/Sxy family protein [Fimbriimonadaceae bacterium]|nr:TfoX/Sxy family protein [Fimbriimonadaceae bacterium]